MQMTSLSNNVESKTCETCIASYNRLFHGDIYGKVSVRLGLGIETCCETLGPHPVFGNFARCILPLIELNFARFFLAFQKGLHSGWIRRHDSPFCLHRKKLFDMNPKEQPILKVTNRWRIQSLDRIGFIGTWFTSRFLCQSYWGP